MCKAGTLSNLSTPKEFAEQRVKEHEEDDAGQGPTESLKGAPEWVKLLAIVATSGLVALLELVICKRAPYHPLLVLFDLCMKPRVKCA